ncbi:MAG: hypothetical protein M1836_003383 [Candelina mexicana]|nr:MAG: hypothetical protein M1836_003383 [Candelina mexicana]
MRARGQRPVPNSPLGPTRNGGVPGVRSSSASLLNRQASLGGVWSFAAASAEPSGPIPGVSNGRGGLMGRGTNAPMYTSRFFEGDNPEEASEKLEGRLAFALDMDQASKVLTFDTPGVGSRRRVSNGLRIRRDGSLSVSPDRGYADIRTIWKDNQWVKEGMLTLLDAPRLRDDFYCCLMAYSATAHCLAVGLHTSVFLWSELHGVQPCNLIPQSFAYVTSLAFSSAEGHQSILAIGRADGKLTLWSTSDATARLEDQHQSSIACVSFKPRITHRQSMRDLDRVNMVPMEVLLVGHENGVVHYYAVEWPTKQDRLLRHWDGMLTLLARVNVHSQQICGLSWSLEGDFFATGGNDNVCCLFEVSSIFGLGSDGGAVSPQVYEDVFMDQHGILKRRHRAVPVQDSVREVVMGGEKFRWVHSAAVKAIAFCPWQRGLIATGGGSNDRCIHFYHTFSGACLATIDVSAQVTSLVWSTTRREIAATFGYAQPEHPFRIAVFSWPDCRQIVAIPWLAEGRALSAIAYPGGPSDPQAGSSGREGRAWTSRTAEEGCIVVASSDESIKFHEIWSETKRSTGGQKGLFGGSDILEGMEGIDKDFAEIIR